MASKPILFSTPMVQAILDGRKTMTRRVIKPQPVPEAKQFERFINTVDMGIQARFGNDISAATCDRSPRYQSGDILWVRETWNEVFKPNGSHAHYIFKASEPSIVHWRPSIHMPKSATRIWLRVTDVRVERVQDITNNDAIKEGCAGAECDCLHIGRSWMGCESCMNTGWQEPPIVEFAQLWDGLNAKRGYGWDSNPWVWVISFERCEKPQEVAG